MIHENITEHTPQSCEYCGRRFDDGGETRQRAGVGDAIILLMEESPLDAFIVVHLLRAETLETIAAHVSRVFKRAFSRQAVHKRLSKLSRKWPSIRAFMKN